MTTVDLDTTSARHAALGLIGPLVNGRTVVLTGSASGSDRMARFLADAGSHTIRVDLPGDPTDTRSRFATYEHMLTNPSEELRVCLDTLDPDGAAVIYAGSYTAVHTLCDRRVIGARSPGHFDAERKDVQWQMLGRRGTMITVTGSALDDLDHAAIVQGVPDSGIAMATSHTYLVPAAADRASKRRLVSRLAADCTQAIVTDPDVGTPCTFYGFVTETAIIDFGPVEALVSWDPQTWRLHAPGILRPVLLDGDVLTAARAATHVVAGRLRQRLGYLGAFGTDGVLTPDGYSVHEVNPRICAGFSLLDQLAPPAAPLAAIDLVLREIPNASAQIVPQLEGLATALRHDDRPAYRLWDKPPHPQIPPARTSYTNWARRIRTLAAEHRQHPLTDLKDLAHEADRS